MATLSFRDRFFSPPVARALTSPSGILALGVGAAVGILATISTGGLAAPIIGGLIGGAAGYGGRVVLAIPRNGANANIDPFGVDEPWRHAVQDAISARTRFGEAVRSFEKGPLRDSLHEIADHLDEAVEEVWKVAKQGQVVAEARKRIDDRDTHWQLEQIAAQIPAGGAASEIQAKTIASLNSQLQSGARMDQILSSTYQELGLLNARLDESVTQAIELSVSNRTSGFAPVGADVDDIVSNLTALREAMTSMDPDQPQSEDPSPAQTDPPGQVQSAPGS